MQNRLLLVTVAALVALQVSAKAAIVTQHVTGYISGPSTVDTQGYFSSPGTDLNGKPFELFVKYRTDYFIEGSCTVPAGSYPGSTCDNHISKPGAKLIGSIDNPATLNSVVILLQLNGVSRSFLPFKQGSVSIFNSPQVPGALSIGSDFDLAAPSVLVQLFYEKPTVFGANLSPINPPANPNFSDPENRNAILIALPAQGSAKAGGEVLDLFVTQSTK